MEPVRDNDELKGAIRKNKNAHDSQKYDLKGDNSLDAFF